MARLPGRSRGCSICRQRRIKCDLKIPECTQCKRNKKKCPGPIVGTFYIISSETPPNFLNLNDDNTEEQLTFTAIDTVESISDPELELDLNAVSFDGSPANSKQNPLLSPSSEDVSEPPCVALQSQCAAIVIPTSYQPSRVEPFEQLFFSHFFETSGRGIETMGSCSWLSKLPGLIVTSFNSKAIRYSARATCMAFYSTLNGELGIWNEAYKTYVRALRSQRGEIFPTHYTRSKSSFPSEEAVCTSIMMFYFEMVSQSLPWAWVNHMDAAAAMLEMRGPENCQSRFVYQLFRTARLGAVFTSVMRRHPHVFAQNRWKEVTPNSIKTELDSLVDTFLSIPEYIEMYDELHDSPSEVILQCRGTTLSKLTRGLASLLLELDNYSQIRCDDLYTTLEYEGSSKQESHRKKQDSSQSMSNHLYALRSAAYVICYSLLGDCEHSRDWLEQAILSSAEVLSAVESVDSASKSHASRMFITTVFPTYVIAMWSPSEKYRALATNRLQHSAPLL